MINETYKNAIRKVVQYLADEDVSLLELLYTEHYNEDAKEPDFEAMSEEELYNFCKDNEIEHIWTSAFELQQYLNELEA